VCSKSIFTLMSHPLLSVYGAKWKNWNPVMFTVYIDDSGTAPDQKEVIAAAMFIQQRRL
jgi:hypothetical protein